MEWWTQLPVRQAQGDVSKRALCREADIPDKTLQNVLMHAEQPGYRRAAPYLQPKMGPYVERIRKILTSDKALPKKQRHTAKRIFERLCEDGYEGGYTQVKAAVHECASGAPRMSLVRLVARHRAA